MTNARLTSARAKQRAFLIKFIHTGRRALGIDEETYRDMLATKSDGKRSSKDLTVAQLELVAKHLRDAGFKPKDRTTRRLDTAPESLKARALWQWLHAIGIVRDPSEAALAAFVRRTAGVDDLRWTRRPDWVIEGIKAWAARQLPAALKSRLTRLHQAGLAAHVENVETLVLLISPTLDPSTFNALQRAWFELDKIETGHDAAATAQADL
ncbi:DUF1018 domain-containing protein [Azoarcus communis]|uniref:regulatory protein GemA n=1 Tax=Parazoarcus communis TaxID=41977 RepID=UPI001459B7B7|nr:regulatory protein GemA [Parazoarcus communis]NMG48254.1 DUF1018 domain-containing protein [Parazoarcus communis]